MLALRQKRLDNRQITTLQDTIDKEEESIKQYIEPYSHVIVAVKDAGESGVSARTVTRGVDPLNRRPANHSVKSGYPVSADSSNSG